MLIVSSDFPGGGVDAVSFGPNDTIYFEAPLDESPLSLWFYFCVKGGKGKRLTFVQNNLERVLGIRESLGYRPVCPVYKGGDGAWQRVPEKDVRFSDQPLHFAFSIPCASEELYVAFCFPYLLEDFCTYVQSKNSSLIHWGSLGKTAEGRDYPMALIGHQDSPEVKNLVMVSARMHAGEVSGSFVLEGLLDALLSDDADAKSLLETTLLFVVPMVDLDSVQDGRYGKDRYPSDYNRDFSLRPHHSEAALIQAKLDELTKRYRLVCALDFHAPQPGGPNYLPPLTEYKQDDPLFNAQWNFAEQYEKALASSGTFSRHDVDVNVLCWGGVNHRALLGAYVYDRFNALMLAFEYAYHRDRTGRLLYPSDWREMGEKLLPILTTLCRSREALCAAPHDVPTWAIPICFGRWESIDKPIQLKVDAADDALVLTPLEHENHVFMVTKESYRSENMPVLEINSPNPIMIRMHYEYRDRQGGFIENGKFSYMLLDGDHTVMLPEPTMKDAAAFQIALCLNDIQDKINIRIH